MKKSVSVGASLALFLALGVATAAAQPIREPRSQRCMSSHEFQNWKAPDERTILVRFGLNRYFELGLAANCPALLYGDSHLVTVFHGSTLICSPNDWDLKVAQEPGSVPMGCIVRSMRELTPSEVDTIPRRFRP